MNCSSLSTYNILFDLDDALLGAAPDTANTLNAVLSSEGESILAYNMVRNYISLGRMDFSRRRQTLLSHYEKNKCIDTIKCLGMENVLDELKMCADILAHHKPDHPEAKFAKGTIQSSEQGLSYSLKATTTTPSPRESLCH